MQITLVAAMDKNRCIGKTDGHNGLPWCLKGDMKHFREVTKGKPMLFGRKTFEAFGGVPLPHRPNIIVTRDKTYAAKGVLIAHSLEEALKIAHDYTSEEIIIGGGAEIYRQALERQLASKMILTEIALMVEGDAFFPSFCKNEWKEISRMPQEEKGVSYDFVVYEKVYFK